MRCCWSARRDGPLRAARDRWRVAPRTADARPWDGRDAGFHARRHLRHRQGDGALGTQRKRRADRPRQYLPPLAAAGAGGHRSARRPAPLHGVAGADPDGFRRLPGVLSRNSAQDLGRRRALRVARQRRPPVPDAGRIDAHPERARLRHRDGVRRVHALRDQRPRGHGAGGRRLDAAVIALGPAQQRCVRAARRVNGAAQRALRHRPGRHVRAPARRVARRTRSTSASTATRSADCRSASPRTRCCACCGTRPHGCRRTGRAT